MAGETDLCDVYFACVGCFGCVLNRRQLEKASDYVARERPKRDLVVDGEVD
jgi:hypothetical protein